MSASILVPLPPHTNMCARSRIDDPSTSCTMLKPILVQNRTSQYRKKLHQEIKVRALQCYCVMQRVGKLHFTSLFRHRTQCLKSSSYPKATNLKVFLFYNIDDIRIGKEHTLCNDYICHMYKSSYKLGAYLPWLEFCKIAS